MKHTCHIYWKDSDDVEETVDDASNSHLPLGLLKFLLHFIQSVVHICIPIREGIRDEQASLTVPELAGYFLLLEAFAGKHLGDEDCTELGTEE